MSFAERSVPAEPDDDAPRTAAAISQAQQATLRGLRQISLPRLEREFVVRMSQKLQRSAAPLTDDQVQQLLRLAWKYRRLIGRHLAPRVNPDDPLSPERAVPWPAPRIRTREMWNG